MFDVTASFQRLPPAAAAAAALFHAVVSSAEVRANSVDAQP